MHLKNILSLSLVVLAAGHDHEDQEVLEGPHQSLWYTTLPGDGGTQADSVFSGISTFGRLPYQPCLSQKDVKYDIAFIGMPHCDLNLVGIAIDSLKGPLSIPARRTGRALVLARLAFARARVA
jgi:hypothetical protein